MLDPPNCIQCSTPLNHTAYAADRIDKDRNLKTLHIMMCLSTCLCLFKLGPDLLYIERLKAPFPSLPFPSLPFPSLPFPSLPFPSSITGLGLLLCILADVHAHALAAAAWQLHS